MGAPMTGSSPARALRGLFLLLLVALMLVLLFLTLRSLLFFASADDGASSGSTAETPPAGPSTTVSPGGATSQAAGVACGRHAEAAPDGSFLVEVLDPGTTGAVVAVDLITSDGRRDGRQVTVAPATDEGPVVVLVPDSVDGGAYVDCVITAIQRGQQVIFTGR